MKDRTEIRNKRVYNILLADDDPDDRDLFEEAAKLLDPAIDIEMVRDGVELMDHLTKRAAPPHMIFLDLNMPKKNGKECLREINADLDLKHIPIVIYTTSMNPLDVDDTYNYGAFHFFKKPNSFEELKDILQKALMSTGSASRSKENYVLNNSAAGDQ